ncbi:MAG: radical SAM family heme chaperone HemW [Coprobacillus sp.]|nr:radical SAM family heme chaperone HemW [Coprobacillus sp.]
MTKINNKESQALYIHIPFCDHLCFYCDFTKEIYNQLRVDEYLISLKREIESYNIKPKQLRTIYIGGGTPSSLNVNQLETLLKMVEPYRGKVKEYTFEANPESFTQEKILLLKEYGVNRISLGVESSNDEILTKINRKHTFNDVVNVTHLLQEAGLNNISFDLILGLPEVTEKMLLKDIDNLLSLHPKHISCYSLEIHDGTVFAKRGIKEMDEDTAYNQYHIVDSVLTLCGFHRYEVSNWSLPHYESKHNLTYWMNEHYYGCGLGASGYLSHTRYKNTTDMKKYLRGEYLDSSEDLSEEDIKEYELMLPLRTCQGLNNKRYKKVTGINLIKTKQKEIKEMVDNGYLYQKNRHNITCTNRGLLALNSVLLKLMD